MKVSIIIPTYNEVGCLDRTLKAVTALAGDFEILVVDGGSCDGTVEIAKKMNIAIYQAPKGRASQMNFGGELAQGDVLLFLHADTILPENAYCLITQALLTEHVVGGCFQLSFDSDLRGLRLSASFTRFTFALFHYGDSAYFVRSDVFRKVGGYNPYPIMEDIDLWLRLRRCGTMIVLKSVVTTSSRRFLRNGVFKQQSLGTVLVLLFLCGVSPNRLKKFYDDVR